MRNKIITLILMAFLAGLVTGAKAETTPAPQKIQTPPAHMSDEALASYITGRLAPLLKDQGYAISQNCDSTGCAVVVQ